MNPFTSIPIIVLSLFLFSCNNHPAATLDYSRLHYDSARITILRWDTLNPAFPNNSDPLPLSQADVQLVDSLVKQAIDSFNKQQSLQMNKLTALFRVPLRDSNVFYLDINHLKFQYVPYINVNYYHVVDIICGCDDSGQAKKYKALWGRVKYFCHFQFTVDLKLRKSSAISIPYDFG